MHQCPFCNRSVNELGVAIGDVIVHATCADNYRKALADSAARHSHRRLRLPSIRMQCGDDGDSGYGDECLG